MNNKTDRPSAFPLLLPNSKNWNAGMSKRFYAACAAMQGILSNEELGRTWSSTEVATHACKCADELLKQEDL